MLYTESVSYYLLQESDKTIASIRECLAGLGDDEWTQEDLNEALVERNQVLLECIL